MIGYPVTAHQHVYGSIVLVRLSPIRYRPAPAEMALMAGVAQQLFGVSIENALLAVEAQRHELVLGELLRQVVGTQEGLRTSAHCGRRIARRHRPVADGDRAGAARRGDAAGAVGV